MTTVKNMTTPAIAPTTACKRIAWQPHEDRWYAHVGEQTLRISIYTNSCPDSANHCTGDLDLLTGNGWCQLDRCITQRQSAALAALQETAEVLYPQPATVPAREAPAPNPWVQVSVDKKVELYARLDGVHVLRIEESVWLSCPSVRLSLLTLDNGWVALRAIDHVGGPTTPQDKLVAAMKDLAAQLFPGRLTADGFHNEHN